MKATEKDFEICRFDFNNDGLAQVSARTLGCDWPVVYMINNKKELYVGETSCAKKRFEQHQQNPERQKLTEIRIIFDESYNKSATQDIEQCLIRLFDADRKFVLQNRNSGFSATHNYYQREVYAGKVKEIWKELNHIGLTNSSYVDLSNSDLFKYSPYVSMTGEQRNVCFGVLHNCIERLSKGEDGKCLVQGCAGTGKTIVAIHMIYLLMEAMRHKEDVSREPGSDMTAEEQVLHEVHAYIKEHGELKISFVLPVSSVRGAMSSVFRMMKNGMKKCPVMGPADVANSEDKFDILFVDESHRTRIDQNLSNYAAFRKTNVKLGLDEIEGCELDWLILKSKQLVLFYDSGQAVRNSDIPRERYLSMVKDADKFSLTSQMRCKGGKLYIDYVSSILECRQEEFLEMENYELLMFDDVSDMVLRIKELDRMYGLCRNVAGYAWKWETKGMTYREAVEAGKSDIVIGEARFIWNTSNKNWVISETAINEIGSIHTVQGFDLNYVGVIFGEEIDYDPVNDCIMVDSKKVFDTYVKANASGEELKRFILNSYNVMMTRGIHGCYVYACNTNLRKYLSKFIKKYNDIE